MCRRPGNISVSADTQPHSAAFGVQRYEKYVKRRNFPPSQLSSVLYEPSDVVGYFFVPKYVYNIVRE